MDKKKILFISHQLPYPPNSGGVIKSWKLINFLSTNYEVGLACLLKEEDPESEKVLQSKIELKNYFSMYLSVPRTAINILKGLFFFKTINYFRNYHKAFEGKIKELANSYDILLIDHYEMHQYIPKNYKGKVILHTHNAEFMLWQRMAELEKKSTIKSTLLQFESSRIKKVEKAIIENSHLVFATPSDQKIYKSAGFSLKNCKNTYHLGDDELLNLPNIEFDKTESAITFMGTMDWEPNVDGLLWFIQTAYPIIKKAKKDIKLYVLGGKVDERIKKEANSDPSIQLTGFVKDLDTYLKKTRVFIVPLRFGSGMKVKVLDGMYRGTPMVSTSVGMEGIQLKHGKEVFIAEDAKAFAKNCITLLNDKSLWEQFRDKSRAVAKSNYLWKDLFERMKKDIDSL